MNLVQSVKTCFKKYLVIDGRASRSEYWWFLLFAGFTPLIMIFILKDLKLSLSIKFVKKRNLKI